MRIALISPWGSPCGISVYAGDVYHELAQGACDVRVYANEERIPTEVRSPDIPVTRCWSMGQPPTWKAALAINRFNPDLVHVQHEIGYFHPDSVWQDWLAFFRTLGKPVVITYHSVPDRPTMMTDGEISAAIVPSPTGAMLLRSRLRVPVYNVEHGVDAPIDPEMGREPYSLVSFGFLAQSKGYSRILQAMALLQRDLPELTLSILGSLTSRWQAQQFEYLNLLLTEIHERGLSNRVDVCCGFRTMREVKAVLRRKSLGVLHYDRTDGLVLSAGTSASAQLMASPLTEGVSERSLPTVDVASGERIPTRCQSAALFRMWSCGLPCIVSKAQHFEVGAALQPALIEAGDVETLADSIRQLCTVDESYRQAVGRIVGCVTRTWKDVADDHVRVFEHVVSSMPSSGPSFARC